MILLRFMHLCFFIMLLWFVSLSVDYPFDATAWFLFGIIVFALLPTYVAWHDLALECYDKLRFPRRTYGTMTRRRLVRIGQAVVVALVVCWPVLAYTSLANAQPDFQPYTWMSILASVAAYITLAVRLKRASR